MQDTSRPGNQDTAQLFLQLSRILYKSALFMRNKANFRNEQMNISSFITSKYEKMDIWWNGKNKANSKPIKANFKRAQIHQRSGKKKGCQELVLGLNCQKGYNVVYGKSQFSLRFGES